MKFLCFGSVNIDTCYSVDHIVLPGETLSSSNKTVHAGGKGGNQAGALAKAGLSVHLAARMGKDGLFILNELREAGVYTDYVDISARFTGEAIIQVSEQGMNSIILSGGGNAEIEQAYIDQVLDAFDKGDTILLQNEINSNEYILMKAKKKGLFVVFNPSPYNGKISLASLESANMIFVNEVEAAQILGETPGSSSYELLLDRLNAILPNTELILTVGKDGAFYRYKDEQFFAPIVDSPIVDTTAAGDTFLGYFLAGKNRGYSPQDALNIASFASSITVSNKGALQSIPNCGNVFLAIDRNNFGTDSQ